MYRYKRIGIITWSSEKYYQNIKQQNSSKSFLRKRTIRDYKNLIKNKT